ncbi:MAG: sugar phosphate nucleotidyltransferase [Desulfovibrionaceae bacterium]
MGNGNITTLVLPAAGLGTRMRETYPDLPKELLPLGNRRIIDFALLEAEDAGMERVVVILNKNKQALRDHLDSSGSRFELVFVMQDTQDGECDAIASARPVIGTAPFAVLYPDNVGYPCPGMLRQVCRAHAHTGLDCVALMAVKPENAPGISNSGRVDLERGPEKNTFNIIGFPKKGSGPFQPRFAGEMRSCGLYVALPHLFDFIEETRRLGYEGELTDGKVRRVMLEQGIPFVGAPLDVEVFDVGNPIGYAACREILS